MINNQAKLFLIFITNGILIGILFDFFRILRKSFKTKDIITYIEDFLFWIFTGIIILYTIFIFNNGEIRLYMFLAISVGIIFYIIMLSSYFIKINLFFIAILKKYIIKLFKILVIPFRYTYIIIKKVFFKPINFIFINIGKFSTNINKISIKIPNKFKNKEGF